MKKKIDLTKGNILQKLLIVAIPTLLTSIVQMVYNLTDMFWVSKVDLIGLVPEEAVAAVGTAGYYPWFGFGLILLVKIGTSVNVSQSAGRNDLDEVKSFGNNGFIMMLGLAILFSLFGYFGKEWYVALFRLENANVVQYSIEYMSVISLFITSMFIVNLFNSIYDGLGKTLNTFLITGSGMIINIFLDPIFILDKIQIFNTSLYLNGLGLGVIGAAIATVIAQTFILLIYLVIYFTKFKPFELHPIKYFNKEYMKKIYRIGVPVGIQSVLFTSISIIIGIMISSYGETVIAVQRVGSQIEALAWMIASGFQVALASFVGQNFGAKQYDRIKKGFDTSLKLLIPYGILVNFILFFFARELMMIFFSKPETLDIGKLYLQILSVSQVFMIIELATAGAFNGLGKTAIPSTVGIVGNALRIPFGYLLSIGLGFAGIWWAISGSSVIKGVVLTVWFFYYLKRVLDKNKVSFEKLETL